LIKTDYFLLTCGIGDYDLNLNRGYILPTEWASSILIPIITNLFNCQTLKSGKYG